MVFVDRQSAILRTFNNILVDSWKSKEWYKTFLFCYGMQKNFLSPLKCVDVIAILWPSKLPSNMLGIASNIINKNGYKVTRNQCYETSKFFMQLFVNSSYVKPYLLQMLSGIFDQNVFPNIYNEKSENLLKVIPFSALLRHACMINWRILLLCRRSFCKNMVHISKIYMSLN